MSWKVTETLSRPRNSNNPINGARTALSEIKIKNHFSPLKAIKIITQSDLQTLSITIRTPGKAYQNFPTSPRTLKLNTITSLSRLLRDVIKLQLLNYFSRPINVLFVSLSGSKKMDKVIYIYYRISSLF